MHEACPSKSPRFHSIDRTQIFLRTTDVESLIPEDHPARDLVVLKSTRPQPIFRGPACRRRTCWAICDFSMLAAVDLDLFICARCLQRTADQSGYGARAGSAMASWYG